jgi:hypothetical protein
VAEGPEMILIKISDGKLEANWDEIVALADEFDQGSNTEDAYMSKIFSLIFDKGYEQALVDMEEHNRRLILLATCTGGHA